jgi:2-methylcitrate dehydratase PrpD
VTPLTEDLATWVVGVEYPHIPPPVRRSIDRALIDTLGVIVAGAAHPVSRTLRGIASPGRCSLAGGGSATAADAALLNGVAAHAWDFDDTSYSGIMHGSAVVLPAVLAAIENREDEGDDETLAAAFAAGSEVAAYLGDALTSSHYDAGWWSTVTIGLVGATAGVARATELSAQQTAHALGLAASAAGGGQAVFGTDAKPVLVGEAARRALELCRLAAAGITAPAWAFEARGGYIDLLNGGMRRPDVPTPGEVWRIHDPGVLVKSSPVCSAAHGVIEAVASVVAMIGASAEQIVAIDCEVPDLVRRSLRFDRPRSPQEAQFSLPFAAACAVLHGRVTLDDLDPARIGSAEIVRLMERVAARVVPGPEASPEWARATVTLSSGATASVLCTVPTGMPGRPLGDDALHAKFGACLGFAGIPSPALAAWNPEAVRPYRRLIAEIFTS